MNPGYVYAGKLRIRVCGLLKEQGKLLLIKIHSPVSDSEVWIPPGGGVDFGESLKEALRREFFEETNLKIRVGELLHTSELIEGPFHAIEFYFSVEALEGVAKLGSDPEHSKDDQLLKELRFFTYDELTKLNYSPAFISKDYWNGVKGTYSLK